MRFAGAETAVKFAYRIQTRAIIARPNLTGTSGASHDGLSPHELHAQGALILRAIERLPQAERAALKAVLAPDGEAVSACMALTRTLRPQLQGRVPTPAAMLDSLQSCTRWKPSVRALQEKHGVSYRQAMKWRRAAGDAHSRLYLRAVQMLEDDLFRPGGLEKQ